MGVKNIQATVIISIPAQVVALIHVNEYSCLGVIKWRDFNLSKVMELRSWSQNQILEKIDFETGINLPNTF